MGNGKENPAQGTNSALGNVVGDINKSFVGGILRNDVDSVKESSAPTNILNGEPAFEGGLTETDAKDRGQNTGLVTKATQSLFNPFTVFRYHKFGPFIDGEYKSNLHYDKNLFGGIETETGFRPIDAGSAQSIANQTIYYSQSTKGGAAGDLELFTPGANNKRVVENPSASTILSWANAQDDKKSWSYGPAPYSASDFLYCKYYGKVPNNRLVTLRRYPFPVEDNIRMPNDSGPAIPLAQAVTWFGEDVDNPLNEILNISWDLLWETKTAGAGGAGWDIDGNEIAVQDLLDGLGIAESDSKADYVKALVASSQGGDEGTLELVGYDKELQNYIKTAYNDDGPYWNRVLGPVNVVDRTTMRKRGMGLNMFGSDISMRFDYSLRSYSGVNPKIAFLDLISNFLSLTYNVAPFWGGGYRYFERPGVNLPNQKGSDLIRQGKVTEGLKLILGNIVDGSSAGFSEIMDQISNIVFGTGQGSDTNPVANAPGQSQIQTNPNTGEVEFKSHADFNSDIPKLADNFLAGRAASLFRAPLRYRSLLEGRPIGEWHVTVGNPMNPIAVIGNLYVKDVRMEFSERLGADDFPTEISFNVTLGHGRPRASQDIESIFNLGNGAMSFSQVTPSSAMDTFGPENNVLSSKTNARVGPGTPGFANQEGYTQPSEQDFGAGNSAGFQDGLNAGTQRFGTNFQAGQNNQGTLSSRIGGHYGNAYGSNVDLISTYLSNGAPGG